MCFGSAPLHRDRRALVDRVLRRAARQGALSLT
jgi:hypothetical protein